MNHQHFSSRKSRPALRRFSSLAVVGAIAVTPFTASAPNAKAAPASPAWKIQKRNRANMNVTVLGTVRHDLPGNDRFTVRVDDGRSAEVISRRNEPLRLSDGDRVELRGDFERGLFIADTVRIVRNEGPGAGLQTTLRGKVSHDFAGREFQLNRDNGTVTIVRSQRPEPLRLTRGDRVEVQGHFEGTLFVARDVNILRNDDGTRVNFPGVVVRREAGNRLIIRSDDSRTFTVVDNSSVARFDHGDRVRIAGFVSGNIVVAQKIELLRNR